MTDGKMNNTKRQKMIDELLEEPFERVKKSFTDEYLSSLDDDKLEMEYRSIFGDDYLYEKEK